MEKVLTKIKAIDIGRGGYDDAAFGLCVTFENGVSEFYGPWDTWMKPGPDTKWTEESRSARFDEIMRRVSQLLHDAKKMKLHELVGCPVEVTLQGYQAESWRTLTEVL